MKLLTAWTALLLAGGLLHADVTIRYESRAQAMGPLQAMLEKAMQTHSSGNTVVMRMKGDKGCTSAGKLIEIFDFSKQEVTVIDPEQKTFTTMPVSKLAESMAGAMPKLSSGQSDAMSKILSQIKLQTNSRMTGQTAVIQGVQAEEREVTVSMDLPIPGQNGAAPGFKVVLDIWSAKADEALKVPAIRELTGYSNWQRQVLDPAGAFRKITAGLPGLGNMLQPLIDEMEKNPTVILRMHTAMYTPMAAMIAQKAAGDQAAAPVDPNAPLMEVNQEVTELSSEPVDASLFVVPKDYTAVEPADIFGKLARP